MAFIFETPNFTVEAADRPFVTRTDGGNIRIIIKDKSITDRTKLSPAQAIEFMRLSIIVGQAMETGLIKRGIPIVKINYHDMGNWAYKTGDKPFLHLHVFGRASGSVFQPFPEAVYLPDRSTGFYDNFEPLNNDDIAAIRTEIEILFSQDQFSDKSWHL